MCQVSFFYHQRHNYSTYPLDYYCAPITKTLLEGLSDRPRNEQVLLGASKIRSLDGIWRWYLKIRSLWMVFTLMNLSDRCSGTRLFAVLNIKHFNCLVCLSARLSQFRARRIWADLTYQLNPVIMRAALFCSFSSFRLRPLLIHPHTAQQQLRCGRISD